MTGKKGFIVLTFDLSDKCHYSLLTDEGEIQFFRKLNVAKRFKKYADRELSETCYKNRIYKVEEVK